MLFTFQEIFDMVIITLFIGYIFKDFIKRPVTHYDPLKTYQKSRFWEDMKHSALIAAPAVILHEFGHKFIAMAFGATAVLHAPSFFGIPYGMYLFVVLLKLIGSPIIFFVGAVVSHTPLPPLQSAMVAVAGPLVNLALYLASITVVKYDLINNKYHSMIMIAGKLNLFLFIFNMLPIPGFDGAGFFYNIWQAFV